MENNPVHLKENISIFEVFKLIEQYGGVNEIASSLCQEAYIRNDLDMAKRVIKCFSLKYKDIVKNAILLSAKSKTSDEFWEIIKFSQQLKSKLYISTEEIFTKCCELGNLDLLKDALKNSCLSTIKPWREMYLKVAARNGRLDVVIWLVSQFEYCKSILDEVRNNPIHSKENNAAIGQYIKYRGSYYSCVRERAHQKLIKPVSKNRKLSIPERSCIVCGGCRSDVITYQRVEISVHREPSCEGVFLQDVDKWNEHFLFTMFVVANMEIIDDVKRIIKRILVV